MATTNTTYSSLVFKDSFQHIGLCAQIGKPLTQTITIDDGTGKLYDYTITKNLIWREYTITPDFTTSPIEPTILDNTIISPNIDDPYDVVGFKSKDQNHGDNLGDILDDTLPIDYDFASDGESLNNGEFSDVQKVLSEPRSQRLEQTVRYFTGWEVKSSTIVKNITKTNLPPEVCSTLDEAVYTVPVHSYLSCSTDFEDVDPTSLRIDWDLYIDANSYVDVTTNASGDEVRTVITDPLNQDWVLVKEVQNNPAFSWTYNDEGQYRLVETATDTDGASTEGEKTFPITFGIVDATGGTVERPTGVIEVERNVWQLCAIPQKTGFWDKTLHKIVDDGVTTSTIKNVVIDQIEDVYGVGSSQLIKVINGYQGDIDSFFNYIPGLTLDNSVHNFRLVVTDDDEDVVLTGNKYEISGFWIKAKGLDFLIKWGQK